MTASLMAWGRVLRLSLMPTAVADGLAGLAIAGLDGFPTGSKLLLFAASVGVYHGSMALNDWADRDEDAGSRPDRPIPSGALSTGAVLGVALGMISLGVGLAFLADPLLGVPISGVAALAVAYNLWLRGPLSGPLALGACRALHMAAPVAMLDMERLRALWYLPLGYGLYVFCLSRLARLEEQSTDSLGKRPPALILCQAFAFAGPLTAAACWQDLSHPVPVIALGGLGAAMLARRAIGSEAWTPQRVQAAVGTALRLLLVYSAACALTGSGSFAPTAAALILLGYPLAHGLRRVFPPT